jgi:hypothetical protein
VQGGTAADKAPEVFGMLSVLIGSLERAFEP